MCLYCSLTHLRKNTPTLLICGCLLLCWPFRQTFKLPSIQLIQGFPGQLRDIITPVCPGSTRGPPLGGICPENLTQEAASSSAWSAQAAHCNISISDVDHLLLSAMYEKGQLCESSLRIIQISLITGLWTVIQSANSPIKGQLLCECRYYVCYLNKAQ